MTTEMSDAEFAKLEKAADKAGAVKLQEWVAIAAYPSKKDFMCGTFFIPHNAPEEERLQLAKQQIGECLPDGYEIKTMKLGRVWFLPSGPNK